MYEFLIRANADSQIGLGHLKRSLVLASALRHANRRCAVITADHTAAREIVEKSRFPALPFANDTLGSFKDVAHTISLVQEHRCQCLIVDSYLADQSYFEQLHEQEIRVAVIDDLAKFSFPCEVVINAGLGAKNLPYESSTSNTRFLLGPKYALLQEGFWNINPININRHVNHVLVMMGGADGQNVTPLVLEALNQFDVSTVTAVVGPLAKNLNEVSQVASKSANNIRIVQNPDSVPSLMLEADLCISAGGQTLLELARVGVPTVAIQVADNQRHNIRELTRLGVVHSVKLENREKLKQELIQNLEIMLTSPELRAQLQQRGLGLIDDNGPSRCAAALIQLIDSEEA